ncbi:MAG: flagellar protein FlgN [bacterium]|nr:flagellar protein FlgN [bacterium]MCP5067373.1 flagellar protein FlgN [bacterium]
MTSNLEAGITGLASVLDAEEKLYVELRDLLQQEHGLMVTLDAEGLEDVARRKEELADEGRLVEETRMSLCEMMTRELGFDEVRPRLSTICERIGPEGRALREAHTRLVVLVSVVRELMDANNVLAGNALSQVRGTLRLLGGLVPFEVTYAPESITDGSSAGRSGVGQLIRRTV